MFHVHYRDGKTKSFEIDQNFLDFPDKKDITAIDFNLDGRTHTLKGSKVNPCVFFMHKVGYSRMGGANSPFEELEIGTVEGERVVVLNVNMRTGNAYVYSTTTKSLGLDLRRYGYEVGV